MTNVVNSVLAPIGTFAASAAGSIPLIPIPTYGGGFTVLNAHIVGNGDAGGTINGIQLVYFTPLTASGLGTPQLAGTLGTITGAAGTPADSVTLGIPITSGYVSPGTTGAWLGIKYASGSIQSDCSLAVSYLMGR